MAATTTVGRTIAECLPLRGRWLFYFLAIVIIIVLLPAWLVLRDTLPSLATCSYQSVSFAWTHEWGLGSYGGGCLCVCGKSLVVGPLQVSWTEPQWGPPTAAVAIRNLMDMGMVGVALLIRRVREPLA